MRTGARRIADARGIAAALALAVVATGCAGPQVQTILSTVGEPPPSAGASEAAAPLIRCGSLDQPTCQAAIDIAGVEIMEAGDPAIIVADSACAPNARCTADVGYVVAVVTTDGTEVAVMLDRLPNGQPGAVSQPAGGAPIALPEHVREQLSP